MRTLLASLDPQIVKPPLSSATKPCSFRQFYHHATPPLMATHKNSDKVSPCPGHISPNIVKFQEFYHSNPSDGWKRCWEEGITPWDLGKPTPVLQHLLQTGSLPKGRALIPGCSIGYDAVTLASPECHVVGLDLSEVAIKKARELASSSPNANYVSFLEADFFTWEPSQQFDLIFDYTFFCAIDPNMRTAWATRMGDLLKPDGELVTLMFPVDDQYHDGGPPYKVSVADYEAVLHPLGFQAISIVENELAVGPRKGYEKIGRWKRTPN